MKKFGVVLLCLALTVCFIWGCTQNSKRESAQQQTNDMIRKYEVLQTLYNQTKEDMAGREEAFGSEKKQLLDQSAQWQAALKQAQEAYRITALSLREAAGLTPAEEAGAPWNAEQEDIALPSPESTEAPADETPSVFTVQAPETQPAAEEPDAVKEPDPSEEDQPETGAPEEEGQSPLLKDETPAAEHETPAEETDSPVPAPAETPEEEQESPVSREEDPAAEDPVG